MTRPASPAAPQPGAPADARPSWAQPLRVHLGVAMVALLVAVAGTIIAFDYASRRGAAVADATLEMQEFADRLVERYQVLADDPVIFADLAAIADVFLEPPPNGLPAKIAYLRTLTAQAPQVDGAFAGYPDGAAIYLTDLRRSQAWRRALDPPPGAALAVEIVTVAADGGRTAYWEYLDHAGQPIGRTQAKAGYDPRTRPWYRLAANRKELVVTPPYEMEVTGEEGVTVAHAHSANPGVVIGVDVVFATLSRFLTAERVTPNAVTLVLDRTGRIVMQSPTPDRRWDKLAAFAAGLPAEQARGAPQSILLDGRPYLATVAIVDSILDGSRVIVAAPLSDLTAGADAELRRDLAVTAIILALGIVAALAFARRITVSLRGLTREADDIGNFVLTAAPAGVSSRIAEIATLGQAMASAKSAIHSFGLYVPVEIVRSLIAGRQAASRSAERHDVTAMFTDIKDFTNISELRPPEEVVSMLSAYFDVINDIVLAHQGALIQFLGDSVYAIWNAPNRDPEHIRHASACAVAMEAAIASFNERQRAKGLPAFETRIGIHSGPAVVGSVGAETRLQYTGMGDTINLASRLEGMNKVYGTTILISQAVHDGCGPDFVTRVLDTVKVKGRAEAVTIYELVESRAKEISTLTPS